MHVNGYVKKFKHLVQLEREEEMLQHEREIKSISGREREMRGRALLNLKGKRVGTGLGGRIIVRFSRKKTGAKLPDTEISVGDLVMLSQSDPIRPDNPTATVTEKTTYSLTVAFESPPPKFLYRDNSRMDLYVNDVTFQRMLDALNVAGNADGRLRKLMAVILGFKAPTYRAVNHLSARNQKLNEYQMKAVEKALSAKDVYLIHGPPGTGKTVSCVEVIHQAVNQGDTVLATADSNIAVDNLLEKLVDVGVKTVRVGHPARVTPFLREHTLDSMIENNERFSEVQQLREKAFALLDERSNHRFPHMKFRRGMSDESIKNMAKRGVGSRGVSSQKIKEMAGWIKLQDRINKLFSEAGRIEEEIIEEIFMDVDVVCTTNSTAGSELFHRRFFDLLVIDEATQSTEPSCLIPLVHAKRVVMAGDHKQLPPTILNQEAERKGLSKTLFERVLGLFGNEIRSVLRIQYRMHRDIMDFSNQEFYNNSLIADESVESHRLSELGVREESNPVIYLDTKGLDCGENTRKGSTSKENPLEAGLVSKIVDLLLHAGVKERDIGIISPYDDQVDLLRRNLPLDISEHLEVKTVDGFQGREKEVIIVSFVRSNPQGIIGFLSDLRRLNVSLTRARRKLILLGDSTTLCRHETYLKLIDYLRERACVFSRMQDFRI